MNSRNTILEELKSLESTLPAELQGSAYAVPAGYFEDFPTLMLLRIRAEMAASPAEEINSISPLLAGISRKMPFAVPGNYFGDNQDQLVTVMAGDEESLVLSFISKEMPYEVPLGYFASLPDKVLERIPQKATKVVPLMRRKWMKMAVAATMAGIMALAGITYFNRDSGNTAVAPVAAGDAVVKEIEKASTEELDAFLKTTDVTIASNTVAKKEAPKKEVKTLFEDVSDKELEAFLDAIPAEEIAMVEEDAELLAN